MLQRTERGFHLMHCVLTHWKGVLSPLCPYLDDPAPQGLVGLHTPQMHQFIMPACHKLCPTGVCGQAPHLFHVALVKMGDSRLETTHPGPFPKTDARKKNWPSPQVTQQRLFPSVPEGGCERADLCQCGSRQMPSTPHPILLSSLHSGRQENRWAGA